jgi:hypothetical protein
VKARSLAAIALLATLAAWAWLRREPVSHGSEAVAGANPPAPEATAEISPAAPEPREPEAAPRFEPASHSAAGARVEVSVLADDEPIAGATIELVPFDETSEFLIGGALPPVLARSETGGDGLARLEGIAPGDYGILAASRIGISGRARLVLTPDAGASRVVLALGSAALEGEVHGLDGEPAVGALVLARQGPRGGEATLWFCARTDAIGSYRLSGLAGGGGRAMFATVLDQALGESIPFELARGEIRRLDFGSAGGRATWSGVVRLPSGEPCRGPQRIFFTTAGSTSQPGSFDNRGRFRAVLPAGIYTAHLASESGPVLGRAEVSGAVEQDLSLPKAVLRGRIRYVGTKHPIARGPENDVQLALERAGQGNVESTILRGASRYAFSGLEPGTYAIATSPWVVAGSADGRASIEIGPGSDEVELDLSITDP